MDITRRTILSHLWGLGVVTCCVLHYITTLYLSLSALSVSSRSSSLLLTNNYTQLLQGASSHRICYRTLHAYRWGNNEIAQRWPGEIYATGNLFRLYFHCSITRLWCSFIARSATKWVFPVQGGVDHACYPIRFQSGVVYSPAVCPQSHTGAQTNINLHGDITVTRIAVAQSECRPCCRQFALVNSTVFRRVPGASPE
jgi:hypothetical protein